MFKNILVLDDGAEISAGKVGQNAILSLTATETVSSTTDLCPGAACSNKLEISIWVEPGNDLLITSGTRLSHYREDASGARTLAGTYWAVKPTRQTKNTYKIYAYDAVSRLDGIQSTWLRSIQGQFPMTLWAFAQLVAGRCGVTITNDALPRNGDYQVQAFYADDLTGRQLLSWVAEASCTFLRATPAGQLEFAWYTDYAEQGIGPGSAAQQWTALNLAGQLLETADGEIWTFAQPQAAYYKGNFSHEAYQTALIDKVQLKQADDDMGVIYPPDETGTNALVIQGNLLLAPVSAESLQPVAKAIYETMQGISYTPLKVEIPADFPAPAPGQIISVTDARGNSLSTYLMSRTISGQRVTLESTGNARRDSTAAVNEQKWSNLQGRLLEISASVDGLKVTASDLQGGMTQLEQTVDSITLSAENDGSTSKLVLSANGVELSSANITFTGMVTFADLSGSGTSVINGDNITTGTIGNAAGNTVYDLDAGTIRTGRSNGSHVDINDRGISWYVENNGQSWLTGVLYSIYGTSYLGANSQYTVYGWVDSTTPSRWNGMQVDNNASQCLFNTSHVDVQHDLGVSGTVSTRDLSAWGNKNRIVRTPIGNLAFAAMESPEPAFCDWGGGTIGEDGVCPVCFSQQYGAAIAPQAVRWLVTPVDSAGSFWVERTDWGALIHGQPGSRFDWLCLGVQFDMAGKYAPESSAAPPAEQDEAAEAARAASMDVEMEEQRISKIWRDAG